MFRFIQNEKTIEPIQAQKAPVMAAGFGPEADLELVRVFASNEDFAKWADKTPHGADVRTVLDLSTKAVAEKGAASWIEKVQVLALQHKMKAFQEFAATLNARPIDEAVIRASTTERTPTTPKLFDPILLYDHIIEHEPPQGAPQDPRTSMLPVPSGYWPDLGWIGWNDRARSVRIFGVNVLCENPWFGGRWAWLVGFNGLMNLNHLLFDRITSSIIAH